MHYEIKPHNLFHLAAELEWFDSRRYFLNQRVLPTVGLHPLREPAVSKVFPQGTFLHGQPAIYRPARIRLQHTEYLAAKFFVTRLLQINTRKQFEPLR